ncbi:phage capsid protein [bacterium]|nr:phage capsid protein [bacterium]
MANTINYASKYERELIKTYIEGSYASPFVVTNVDWLDGKNFHFTQLSVGGYKEHNIAGGWNRQNAVESDKTFTLTQDRDVEFFLDKREVDESNQTATIQNVSKQFEDTQAVPEKDAYFFSKIAKVAKENDLYSSTAKASYTSANIYTKLVQFIGRIKRYRNKGLVVYLAPELMDLLALSTELTHPMEIMSLVEGGKSIQTRVTRIDGVPIVEVIDDDRFYSEYDFTDGYEPKVGAVKINILGATPLTTKMVPKISSIYFFAPGEHTEGDGYLYQNRAFYDTFVFPNGKDNNIDSIYVDLDTTQVVSL